MKLVFLGPPGVGKGTQAQMISEELGAKHLSTGDMLREAVAGGTSVGLKAKVFMDKGELVPDEVIIALVRDRITKPDCEKGFILDGFPRTTPQAEALDVMLNECNMLLDGVVSFTVSDKELIRRLGGRRTCPSCGATFHIESKQPKEEGICTNCSGELITRDDDQPEAITRRLQVYEDKTSPLIAYYQNKGLLRSVDASASPDVVMNNVRKAISL